MPLQSQMIIRDDERMRDGMKNIREFLGPFDAAWSAIEPALHRLRDLVLQVRRLDPERRIGDLLAAHTVGCREIAKLVNTVQGFASETGHWAEETAYLLKALKHSELNNFQGAVELCDALAKKVNSIGGNVQQAAILGDQLAQAAASMHVFAMEVNILRNAFMEELADLEAYSSSTLTGVLDFVWETASCIVKLFGGLLLQGSWTWNSTGKKLAEGVIEKLSENQLSWRQMRQMETIAYKEAIANLTVLSEKLDNGRAWVDTAAASTGFMETQLGTLYRQVMRLQNPNVTMNGRLEIDPMIRLVLEIKREADNVAGLPLSKAVRGF